MKLIKIETLLPVYIHNNLREMSIFIENTETIAMAIATLRRAVKEKLIEEDIYKDLIAYLKKQKKTYHVKKSHIAQAYKDLDNMDEYNLTGLEWEDMDLEDIKQVEEQKADDLYSAAEQLLDEFNASATNETRRNDLRDWNMKHFKETDDEMLREAERAADKPYEMREEKAVKPYDWGLKWD
jgi:hypothetical protein